MCSFDGHDCIQAKKQAEVERQKELAELFAVAIKQPKVPVGRDTCLPLPNAKGTD